MLSSEEKEREKSSSLDNFNDPSRSNQNDESHDRTPPHSAEHDVDQSEKQNLQNHLQNQPSDRKNGMISLQADDVTQDQTSEESQKIQESPENGATSDQASEKIQKIQDLSATRDQTSEKLHKFQNFSPENGITQDQASEKLQKIQDLSTENGATQDQASENLREFQDLSLDNGVTHDQEKLQEIQDLSPENGATHNHEKLQEIQDSSPENGEKLHEIQDLSPKNHFFSDDQSETESTDLTINSRDETSVDKYWDDANPFEEKFKETGEWATYEGLNDFDKNFDFQKGGEELLFGGKLKNEILENENQRSIVKTLRDRELPDEYFVDGLYVGPIEELPPFGKLCYLSGYYSEQFVNHITNAISIIDRTTGIPVGRWFHRSFSLTSWMGLEGRDIRDQSVIE
ncbi:3076_t:CDS:2 [Funneliformis geosporum]|uniref:1333_t:CDS:1 n=1 Tax=Funneliformis geosporum TaxID=1117311 RepID=A0A9W4SDH1_9GLOM|nr:3076_t:CDS:2 [Funneliformis geosporum]CAI2165374.1 1333_t:CDS:2 [Funneliformis geosporum]